MCLGIALGTSCSPCRDEDERVISIDDGTFTDPGDREVQFPRMSTTINGDAVEVTYPRGGRIVRVTLKELP